MVTDNTENPKSILIAGETGHGKSVSLMPLADREDVLYFNCESGKPLPFKNKFTRVIITDPIDIMDYLDELIELGDENPFNIIIIDTVSFMMDMLESVHVIGSVDTQAAWGHYGQFFPNLMNKTAEVDSFFIFLGHLDSFLDEDEGVVKYSVPVKGAMKKKGIESRFTTVLYVKKMKIKAIDKGLSDLDAERSKLLNVTPKEEKKGYKHVFLTDSDKTTVGGRIRTPIGMFSDDELYIDNDALAVLQRLDEYYSD